jgi:ubiquitin-protein ligase
MSLPTVIAYTESQLRLQKTKQEEEKKRNEISPEEEALLNSLKNKFETVNSGHLNSQYKPFKPCSLKNWIRVLKETDDVLSEVLTLRCFISPVEDFVGVLHFLISPADGSMADKFLCGRVLFTSEYPNRPPIVQVFTTTSRYNVDVFNYATSGTQSSSLCFDILRSKEQGGIWMPEYTLSALMASLMLAITSFKVPQQYGPDKEEYVSMEKLHFIDKNIWKTLTVHKSVMPQPRPFRKIIPVAVPSTHFEFPRIKDNSFMTASRAEVIYSSLPIHLQTNKNTCYSIGIDLSEMKNNPFTVFSIVLSTSQTDMTGKEKSTVLLRNGVTATSAKKLENKSIEWFYHGVPMNDDNLQLIVTVGMNQFTICYKTDKHPNYIVHGDCAVSFLTPAEIGNVKGKPFYLNLYTKTKKGDPVKVTLFKPAQGLLHPSNLPVETNNTSLPVETNNTSLPVESRDAIHSVEITNTKESIDDMKDPFYIQLSELKINSYPKKETPLTYKQVAMGDIYDGELPIFVSLELSSSETANLHNMLADQGVDISLYSTKKEVGHVTLAFHSDFQNVEEYKKFVGYYNAFLKSNKTKYLVQVIGFAQDACCVALSVKLIDETLLYYPLSKKLHITMLLEKKPAVYSNQLLERVQDPNKKEMKDRWVVFDKPIVVNTKLVFSGKLRVKK